MLEDIFYCFKGYEMYFRQEFLLQALNDDDNMHESENV